MLALGILGLLVLITILSWFSSLAEAIKDRRRARAMEEDIAWQIGRARQMGVSMSDVYIDGNGDMRYCDDDTPVI